MKLTEYFTKWLRERPYFGPLNKLEQELNLPQGCLSKSIRGVQALPVKHMDKLLSIAIQYGFKIFNKDLDYNEDAGTYCIENKVGNKSTIVGFENLKELCDYFKLELA